MFFFLCLVVGLFFSHHSLGESCLLSFCMWAFIRVTHSPASFCFCSFLSFACFFYCLAFMFFRLVNK